MLSAAFFDLFDEVARNMKMASKQPFGGLQVIPVGDCQQLPPAPDYVQQANKDGKEVFKQEPVQYLFQSEAWSQGAKVLCKTNMGDGVVNGTIGTVVELVSLPLGDALLEGRRLGFHVDDKEVQQDWDKPEVPDNMSGDNQSCVRQRMSLQLQAVYATYTATHAGSITFGV
ncbi:DNA helicase [Trebouxia sp. C0009 RCD-2024]